MRWRRPVLGIGVASLALLAAGLAASWWLGGALLAPQPAAVGPPPTDLHARSVRIDVPGTAPIAGWWSPGKPGRASVLLLHGIRADRRAMLERARLLSRHGYAVLLVDLPAHGESAGKAITLGWREAVSVTAARDWMHRQRPSEKLAVTGVSLGGASVLLGPQPSGFDAVVLEAVYSNARQAIRNRIAMRLGDSLAGLSPLLEMQARWRLDIPVECLAPIDRIQDLGAPVLLIAGGRDRHTLPRESRVMFQRARQPKAFWLLPEAGHVDYQAHDPDGYADHVIGFLDRHLGTRPTEDSQVASKRATAPASNGQSSSAPVSLRCSTGTRMP